MPHPVLALALIDEAVGIVHDVLVWIAVGAEFEASKQVTGCRSHDFLHFPHGLLDPIAAVFQ